MRQAAWQFGAWIGASRLRARSVRSCISHRISNEVTIIRPREAHVGASALDVDLAGGNMVRVQRLPMMQGVRADACRRLRADTMTG